MKFLAGWIAGLATAWAALAIWNRIPPFPDIEPEPAWRSGRPGFHDSTAGGSWPPPPTTDPHAFY